MSEQHQGLGLDAGLIGALSDVGFAVALAVLLAIGTDWTGDAAPRPLVIAVLYGTPGLIGLLGVLAQRPWLLIAGALPLFPAAGLAFSGATLVFLVPAFLMLAGAASMAGKPDSARMSLGNVLAGGAIVTLLLVGGWSVLIGMTVAGCYPIPGGEACSDHYISTNGLLVGGICVVGALAIAVVGAGLPKMLGRAGR